jgi:RNA polymerase sigma-70 factor, ECF subfamily
MEALEALVVQARDGSFEAYGRLVEATQPTAYAVAMGVLRDSSMAQDAVQEAYLRAFRRLGHLQEPAVFTSWLRRIVITVALNMQRGRRQTFLRLDDVAEVPVLDEAETTWTESQRRRLAAALVNLSSEERRLCDRRYHGHWSTARLAADAGVDEAVMRKRLQRIRDKLRKEIEVSEQRGIPPEDIHADLPTRVVELLARPQLTNLPENPVGKALELLRTVYADFDHIDLPEVVDFEASRRTIGDDALYLDPLELHRIEDGRILRYDLTLPLLLTVRYDGRPLRIWTAGKAYRRCQVDATHMEAFHQAEAFWLAEGGRSDSCPITGHVLRSVNVLLPGRAVRIVPTEYPMCREAWDLEVEEGDRWVELLAWGIFSDRVVRHLGGDPDRQTASGVGYGLERLAMLRYGIDDIRKVEVASV